MSAKRARRVEGVRVLTAERLGDGRARFVVQEAGPVRDLTLSYPPEGGVIVGFILNADEMEKLRDSDPFWRP